MKTGHYEVTQEAAEWFGFSSAAVSVLRDAAQDPDFYDWYAPEAHAQTPNAVDYLDGAPRDATVAAAITKFVDVAAGRYARVREHLANDDVRTALYWLGYLLHGVQDLAPHAGRTNAEYAAGPEDPDADPRNIDLARHYTYRLLRTIREAVGGRVFDCLREWDGDGAFSHAEKVKRVQGHDWDLSYAAWRKYERDGEKWTRNPPPLGGIRWPRERVLDELASRILAERTAEPSRRRPSAAAEEACSFEPLAALPASPAKAAWTVFAYMAGDDLSADSIEYAVRQDLHEMKSVGSTDRVHFVAQTDEATERRSYRYRLRRGTPLAADRLEVFRGDVNTGRVGTLVDFVRWGVRAFPAERYALVLWGHGSGHDDHNVYRLARGTLSPRLAAHLVRRRLGFFQSSRRAAIERGGPSRGFGFDDTAADFLDNSELRSALLKIRRILGKPLDLLGFDACLMAMVEVAYQARGAAAVLVSSQLTEPGDGWRYDRAFRALVRKPLLDPETLARRIVAAFRETYGGESTLSAFRVTAVEPLAAEIEFFARSVSPGEYARARRAALDSSPDGPGGHRDLGTFLDAIGPAAVGARRALAKAVLAACGRIEDGAASGIDIYLPDEYRPEEPGGTDEIYERLDFPATRGWAAMLRRVATRPHRPTTHTGSAPQRLASLHALDHHTAPDVLRSVIARDRTRWLDPMRLSVLEPLRAWANDFLGRTAEDADADLRIVILPGITGSQLSDRAGGYGLIWIDPIGLVAGDDFATLRLTPDGERDLDRGVRIEAVGSVPVLYDRLALALLATFGPVVEQVGYDWRHGVAVCGRQVAARLRRILAKSRTRRVAIVAHSMGGLVAAHAVRELGDLAPRVVATVALGVPWRGSFDAAYALRGEGATAETFARLCHKTREEVIDVVQRFWGLTDLLPPDCEALLAASLYAPGPLSRSSFGAHQLASPRDMGRRPPAHTTALVGDRAATVVGVDVRDGVLVPETGPGDGVVPLASATAGGDLPSVRLDVQHATMPLEGDAIAATLHVLRQALAAQHVRNLGPLPALPPLDLAPATSRGALLSRLDAPAEADLRVGELLSLLRLL
jgi:hypothetical protein